MVMFGIMNLRKSLVWKFAELLLILVFVTLAVPAAKNALFPSKMTLLERMLRGASFQSCILKVEHPDELLMLVTVAASNEKPPITTEIYRDELKESDSKNHGRSFFAYSINRHPDGSYNLTHTRIEADAHLNRVRRLEVKVCDRLVDKDGQVRFNGPEPIIECAVPIQAAVCLAAE